MPCGGTVAGAAGLRFVVALPLAVRALRAEVGDSVLRAFLARAPHRLDRRTRRFLEVVLANTIAEQQKPCTKTLFRRDSAALFWR